MMLSCPANATMRSRRSDLASLSHIGRISHSSSMSSFAVPRSSGSHVNSLRVNLKNISFSSPGGIVVTKSSSDVCGIGHSANVHFPEVYIIVSREPDTSMHGMGCPTFFVEEHGSHWARFEHCLRRISEHAGILCQRQRKNVLPIYAIDGIENVLAFQQLEHLFTILVLDLMRIQLCMRAHHDAD